MQDQPPGCGGICLGGFGYSPVSLPSQIHRTNEANKAHLGLPHSVISYCISFSFFSCGSIVLNTLLVS